MAQASDNLFDSSQFPKVLDGMPVAVTIVDLDGTILYFNAHAMEIVARKPEHLGSDIRQCHRKTETNAKIDILLKEFATGERTRFSYRAHRYGRLLDVVFTPLATDGRVSGVIQTVMEVVP